MATPARPRGLLFGAAAESYERFRIGYPDGVIDRTLHFAGRRVATAVEVGAGTGKATRVFASRGIRVTALEPDVGMFGVLQRETVGMPVTPVRSAFEEYDGPPVDLVYAASSLHWTDPASRWSRVAALLAQGGVVAVFGSAMTLADPDVRRAVEEARRPFVPDDVFHPVGSGNGSGRPWPANELDESELFTDVADGILPREVVLPNREYVGYLSTVSAFLQLPVTDRQEALHRIGAVLPEQVAVDASVGLVLARRV